MKACMFCGSYIEDSVQICPYCNRNVVNYSNLNNTADLQGVYGQQHTNSRQNTFRQQGSYSQSNAYNQNTAYNTQNSYNQQNMYDQTRYNQQNTYYQQQFSQQNPYTQDNSNQSIYKQNQAAYNRRQAMDPKMKQKVERERLFTGLGIVAAIIVLLSLIGKNYSKKIAMEEAEEENKKIVESLDLYSYDNDSDEYTKNDDKYTDVNFEYKPGFFSDGIYVNEAFGFSIKFDDNVEPLSEESRAGMVGNLTADDLKSEESIKKKMSIAGSQYIDFMTSPGETIGVAVFASHVKDSSQLEIGDVIEVETGKLEKVDDYTSSKYINGSSRKVFYYKTIIDSEEFYASFVLLNQENYIILIEVMGDSPEKIQSFFDNNIY